MTSISCLPRLARPRSSGDNSVVRKISIRSSCRQASISTAANPPPRCTRSAPRSTSRSWPPTSSPSRSSRAFSFPKKRLSWAHKYSLDRRQSSIILIIVLNFIFIKTGGKTMRRLAIIGVVSDCLFGGAPLEAMADEQTEKALEERIQRLEKLVEELTKHERKEAKEEGKEKESKEIGRAS